jgi:phage recombination protein Bet
MPPDRQHSEDDKMANNVQPIEQVQERSLLRTMAHRYEMEPAAFHKTLTATIIPGGKASNEQLAAFLVVAQQYNLNPFTREIYAFPAKGGGIQPIVGIDGWLKLANANPKFDGLTYREHLTGEGELVAITAQVYRKDREHPVEVTEYMAECKRNTDPWQKWPRRMLRHKATTQALRAAFGFSGIVDPDEAERMKEVRAIEESPVKDELNSALEAAAAEEVEAVEPPEEAEFELE